MAGWGFLAMAAGLAILVALVLMAALRRVPVTRGRGEADLAVYRDQLSEIERDLTRGTLTPDEAGRLRAEVGKRLLVADRARSESGAATGSARSRAIAGLVVALTLPGAMATYWWLGAPGYPDMALAPRLQALDAGIAGRPAQEEELQRLNLARDPALDQRLQGELAPVSDPEALRELFRQHFEAGELQAAVRVQERLLALLGDAAASNDHALMALALMLEAQGYVSPEAEVQMKLGLQRDMTNEIARYMVGEMFLQGGRYDLAFQFWRPLAENGSTASPFVKYVRDQIFGVAELAGIRYDLPAAGPGPSADDMAAAGEMTPEERQQMIEGMVAQLSDRLATEGGTVEEWNRLIRSLAILERLPEAQTIYDEAKAKFEGRPAELSFLRLAAVETGLNP
jgi:cytochrome c-type biogenesis protein CcmH